MDFILSFLTTLFAWTGEKVNMYNRKSVPWDYGNAKPGWQKAWEQNGRKGNPYRYHPVIDKNSPTGYSYKFDE